MEAQERPAALRDARPTPRGGWLVSPAFDLFLVANLAWPLLLVPGVVTGTDTALDFWQVYFLTLPHRWLTLVLVATDPDRRAGIDRRLVGAAAIALVVVVGVLLGTGGLTCLAVVDFAWNAWHFGAQHAGVLRMYSRKAGLPPSRSERWAVRGLVTYTLSRTVGWAVGWVEPGTSWGALLTAADVAALACPVGLLAQTVVRGRWTAGRTAYLASVTALYAGLLGSIMADASTLTLALTTAAAAFHAAEYLAIVTVYARGRTAHGSGGRFRKLAENWGACLGVYVLALGFLGVVAEQPSAGLGEAWLALNTWAALVHYSFDGLIWKLRQPATARALSVGGAS